MTVRLGDKIIMPTNNIVKAGTKYGATAGSLLGDVDANGVLQQPSEPTDLVFTGVKDIVTQGLQYKFYKNTGIKSVSFPDLETVSTTDAMRYAFNSSSLESISFSKLTTVSGNSSLTYACSNCTSLASASLPELATVSNSSGIQRLFASCPSLASVTLPKLATLSGTSCAQYLFYGCALTTFTFTALSDISGNGCLRYAFQSCPNLTSLSFPALTTNSFGTRTNQFQTLFDSNTASTSGAFTVHFPSNMQSTISGLTGYPTFGADSSRITLLFDLTATS